MSIWEIGIQSLNNKEKSNTLNDSDTTIFVVGDKLSGKTTIISKFIEKIEIPKSTVALDYSFYRHAKGHNIPKFVSHIWELGGGSWLQKLIDVAITWDNLRTLTFVVVVDLSEPHSIFTTIETLVNAAKARIKYILDKSVDGDDVRAFLEEKRNERIGKCSEMELINPLLIPLVIVGGKFDKFQEFDLKKRTIICKTLRFLNHFFGGTLVFFSSQQEVLINRIRIVLRHQALGSSMNKTIETSSKNPLSIPVGSDSFVDIGTPEFSDGSLTQLPSENLVQWKRAYFSFFSPKDSQTGDVADPGKNPQFEEPLVDEEKRQKDEELEKYRKLSDRRMRDLRQQAINDGIIVI